MLSLHKLYKASMGRQHKVIWPDENNGRKWPLTCKLRLALARLGGSEPGNITLKEY
jgi:hypothetical protein